MEGKELLKLIPKRIDKETKEFIDQVAFNESRYLFIEKKDNKKIGYCTSCNKEYEADEKHNDWILCKKCGKRVQVKLTRYSRKSVFDSRTVLVFQKALKGFDGIIARGFYVSRDYTGNYRNVKTNYKEIGLYIFGKGKSIMFNKQHYYGWHTGNNDFSKERRERFYQTSTVFNFNINSLSTPPYFVDKESFERAVKGTRYQYVERSELFYGDILKYLKMYTKYPVIESLEKIGLETLVNHIVRGYSLERQINWKGKTIFKFLKLDRGELKEILNSQVRVTPKFLKIYRECKRNKYKLTVEEIKDIENMGVVDDYYRGKILHHVNIKQMYRYAVKQYNKSSDDYSNYGDVVYIWNDYIKDLKKLKMDINKNLFPKDLFNKHLALQKQIKYLADKKLNEMIKFNKEARKKMSYKNKDFIIRAAESSEEIINEGKILHHCVGGYAKQHAEGTTNILFIRKVGEENEPYYTVEISSNCEVIQVRAKHNKGTTKEIRAFMKEYEKEVLNKLKKQKNKIKIAIDVKVA